MGRNTAFRNDPAILKKLSAALAGGATRLVACDNAGISFTTLEKWMGRDDGIVLGVVEAAEQAARNGGVMPTPRVAKTPERTEVDPWALARAEAEELAPGETLYGWLLWLEGRIASHNERAQAWERMPVMPPAVLAIFRAFWASGKQELVIRAGRGFGKSTVFCRPVLVECMFAPRVVNGGEIAIWPELSVDMDEANLKVGVLENLLKIAGFRVGEPENVREFKTLKQERGRSRIKFTNAEHEQIEIRVYPATVAALSGPTLKGARHDEEAKWKADSKAGTNSAQEVIDAEGGAFRGRPHAHLFRVSSAWKTEGPHYRDVEGIDEHGNKVGDGDTPDRFIARIGADFLELALAGFEARAIVSKPADAAEIRAYAATLTAASPSLPSWFNPSLDPRTLKASSVRVFLREYGSRSSGSGEEGDFFDAAMLDAAEQLRVSGEGPCFCAIDPASRGNAASMAIVRKVKTSTGYRYPPVCLLEWIPARGAPLDLRLAVLPEMARAAVRFGCAGWVTDVHALTDVEIVGTEHGLTTRCRAEGDAYRLEYAPVRNALNRGELVLSGCVGVEAVVVQLRAVSSELGDRGHVRIVLPAEGDLHGDLGRAYVSACAEAGAGLIEAEEDEGYDSLPSRYAGAA